MHPPPILWALEGQRALIVGQAPGITEPVRRRPFAGAAGRKLVTWLAPLGIRSHEDMLARFAFASVAKCYPGRLPGGRGDRVPDRGERRAASPGRTRSAPLRPRWSCPSAGSRSTTGRPGATHGADREALRAGRPRDRAAPPPLGCERVDERPRDPGARRQAVAQLRDTLSDERDDASLGRT